MTHYQQRSIVTKSGDTGLKIRTTTYAKAFLSGVNFGATDSPKAAAEAMREAAMMSFMMKSKI
jgi:hypothetical protein